MLAGWKDDYLISVNIYCVAARMGGTEEKSEILEALLAKWRCEYIIS